MGKTKKTHVFMDIKVNKTFSRNLVIMSFRLIYKRFICYDGVYFVE